MLIWELLFHCCWWALVLQLLVPKHDHVQWPGKTNCSPCSNTFLDSFPWSPLVLLQIGFFYVLSSIWLLAVASFSITSRIWLLDLAFLHVLTWYSLLTLNDPEQWRRKTHPGLLQQLGAWWVMTTGQWALSVFPTVAIMFLNSNHARTMMAMIILTAYTLSPHHVLVCGKMLP